MKIFLGVSILLALCVGTGFSTTTPAFDYTSQCTNLATALVSYSAACSEELTNVSSIASNPTSLTPGEICYLIYDLLDCVALQITANDLTQASACLSIMTSISANLSSVLVAVNVQITDPAASAVINTIDCGSYYVTWMSSNYGMYSTYPSYPSTTYSYPGMTMSSSISYNIDLGSCYNIAAALGNYSLYCATEILAITQLPNNNDGPILCEAVLEILKCLAYQITLMDQSEYYFCLNVLTSANGNLTNLLGVLSLSNVTIPGDLQVTALNASCGPIYSSQMTDSSIMPSTSMSYPMFSSMTFTMTSSSSFMIDWNACYNISQALTSHYDSCLTKLTALLSLPDTETDTLCTAIFEIFECLSGQITSSGSSYEYGSCLDLLADANQDPNALLNIADVLLNGILVIPSTVRTTASGANCSSTYSSLKADFPMSSTPGPISGGVDCANIGGVILIIANNSAMAACFNPLLSVTTQESFCMVFNASLNCLATQLMPSNSEACLLLMQSVAYVSASQILALLPPLGINLTAEVTGFAANAYVACQNSSTATSTTTSPTSGSDCSDVATVGDSITGPASECQVSFARILTATNINDYCSNFTTGLRCMAPVLRPGDETQCLKDMKTQIELNATALLDYIVLNVLSAAVSLPTHIQNFAQNSADCALETSDRAVICSSDSHCTDVWQNLICDPSQICMKTTDDSCSLDSDCRHTLLRCLEDSNNAPNKICVPVIKECNNNCSGEPLTFCESSHELGYQAGYCKPVTCTDNSTCVLSNSYCSLDGACDCAPGYYFIDGICTDTFVTGVTYTVGLLYNNGYPLVQHKCIITDTLVDAFTYEVKWIRQNQIGTPLEVLKTMAVTSSTPEADIVLSDNELPNTYILNDVHICNVSVKDSSGIVVQPPVSSPPLKLLEVENTNVTLKRGEMKKFCFTLRFPFGCQPGESCTFDLMMYDTSDDNSCSAMSLAMSGNETCGCKATPKTQTDVSLAGGWLPYTPESFCCYITTKNEFKRSFSGSKTLNLKTAFSASSLPVPYVEGTLMQTVSATVTDPFTGIPSCKLFSNGYVWTFDNRYISLRGGSATGRYIAYKHTDTNTEIQFGMKQSDSNNFPEITSVFVRSGKSIAKILHNSTDHVTGILQSPPDGVDRFRFIKLNNNQYALRLPHGTEIAIHIESEYGFSLTGVIFASPSDDGKTTGLCGNLDGEPNNDPTDGSAWIATDNYDLNATRASLSGWTNAEKKCVCSSPYTINDRICSFRDDEVCSGGLIAPQYGTLFKKLITRRRRSVEETFTYESLRQPSKLSAILQEMVEDHSISKRDAASCDTELQSICPMLGNTYIFSADDRTQIVDTQCGLETNSSVDWARLSCTPLQMVALQYWYRDNHVTTNNPEYEHICVGGCLNNGTCSNGNCQCATGFAGDSCHLNISEPVVVISDIQIEVSISEPPTCYNLTSSNGFSSTATCRAVEFSASFELTDRITFTQTSITFSLLILITTYEGQCCPTATGRRRRSTGTTNSQYQISVSNDGQTYSDPIVVTTIDSTCQNITSVNGSNYIQLLSGYCFIDGVCYNDSDANPSSSCQYCTTSHSVFNWNDTCVYNTGGDKDDGLPGYAIALIVISVLAVIAGVASAFYILVLKKKLHQRIGDLFARGLVREPTNSKFIIVKKEADMNAAWKDPNGVPGMTEAAWRPQQ